MVLADTPSMGLWLGLPIVVVVVLACVVWCLYWLRSNAYDKGFALFIGAGVAAIIIAVALVAYWPYKHDYHYFVPKSGKVERVSNRFISNGDKGVSQRFVVVIKGQPYGVDDTRASLVRVGDFVKLHCKKEFDWGSSDQGWACKWG